MQATRQREDLCGSSGQQWLKQAFILYSKPEWHLQVYFLFIDKKEPEICQFVVRERGAMEDCRRRAIP
uniref:Uncharacterized protein MANES_02G033200 n=1 Tax=Rhizophora mucronata TaxID=61149 RepID=A0A2P2JH58_RHIMU